MSNTGVGMPNMGRARQKDSRVHPLPPHLEHIVDHAIPPCGYCRRGDFQGQLPQSPHHVCQQAVPVGAGHLHRDRVACRGEASAGAGCANGALASAAVNAWPSVGPWLGCQKGRPGLPEAQRQVFACAHRTSSAFLFQAALLSYQAIQQSAAHETVSPAGQ